MAAIAVEFEALYPDVQPEEVRARMTAAGGHCVVPRRLMRRQVLYPPKDPNLTSPYLWVRVRDEGDKVTASVKGHDGSTNIAAQTEVSITVDSYDKALAFAESLGCVKKSYQENYRETWDVDGAEVVIDEWPYMEPYVEIEADSEEHVRAVSEKLGFVYADALFENVITLYHRKYGWPHKQVTTLPRITFDDPNPFV